MNYISLNAKYYKTQDFKHIYEHDFRVSNVTYKLENTQYKNFEHEFEKFEDLHSKKAQIMLKKGTNLRSNENSVVEFVAALSREQTEQILKEKDGYEKLNNALKSTMEEISKKYGFTSLFYSFHADEGYKNGKDNVNNFHAHLCFYNYDFSKEKSVLKGIKKDEWGKMQDLAAQCFKECGLNYVRGEKKTEKGKDHLERKYFIASKKEVVKDINNYLDTSVKNVIDSSTEKGIFSNKLDTNLLQQNIKKEVLKALKFDLLTQEQKDKIKKFDKQKLQIDMLKKEVEELQQIKKMSIELINKYENLDKNEEIQNLKNDVERAEVANDILRKNLENEKQQNENLNKKLVEKNAVIASLNNQLQSKMSPKNKNIDR
ncbi:hypothetical protein SUSP_001905 [Sulfurospirillum sp. 'SP']|nr:hypothetical protein [Sulfurospirillum sp. 'SP']WNY99487.1 hypothetical protein SUSP_001905 [Sulfurospirillum sp. 'SP']